MALDQIFIINVLNFDCVKMNKKIYLNSAPNLVYDEVILNHRQKHKMKANPLALNLILVFLVFDCFYLMWFSRSLHLQVSVTLSSPDRPLLTHTVFLTQFLVLSYALCLPFRGPTSESYRDRSAVIRNQVIFLFIIFISET